MANNSLAVWRTVFRAFDRDGNGRIDRPELSRALKNLGGNWTDDRIDTKLLQYDADGELALTFEQFLALVTGAPALVDPELARAFRSMDLDGDGSITATELKSLFEFVGVNANVEIDAFIAESDLNGDGKIDFKEFMKLSQEPDAPLHP